MSRGAGYFRSDALGTCPAFARRHANGGNPKGLPGCYVAFGDDKAIFGKQSGSLL